MNTSNRWMFALAGIFLLASAVLIVIPNRTAAGRLALPTATTKCNKVVMVPGTGLACRDGSLWRVQTSDGMTLWTHGPDPRPGVNGFLAGSPRASSSTRGPARPAAVPAAACVDPATTPHVEIYYAHFSDRPDQYSSYADDISTQFQYVDNNVLDYDANQYFGYHVHLLVQCNNDGTPFVGDLTLATPFGSSSFQTIVDDVQATSHTSTLAHYWIWTDGNPTGWGGQSTIAADDQPGPDNANNNGPQYSVNYGFTLDQSGGAQFAHENGHAMGAVQLSAPNSTGGYHCIDGQDIMCYDDSPAPRGHLYNDHVCGPAPNGSKIFDCNFDDYFNPSPAPGSYLATHWNVGQTYNRFIRETLPPTPTPTPCPTGQFSDVQPSDYFYAPVTYLVSRGVVSGYADCTFRPGTNTTRGQLSKIVILGEGWAINTTGGPHFSDVPPDNPFYGYIETAYNRGIISGYGDGTFRWGANVTRGQLSKIIVGAQGWAINTSGAPHFSDLPASNPFYPFVETAYNQAIISGYGDGTFRWGTNATRGQIAKIVYNALVSSPTPTPPPSPTPFPPCGGDFELFGVAAAASNDVWALGDCIASGISQARLEHWNGAAWSLVPSPNPGSASNFLTQVTVVASNDVWAVGYFANAGGVNQTLVEHWNGSSWSVVPSPNPGSGGNGVLYGVAAVAANDVWAVGTANLGNVSQTLAEHWNGSSWSVVPSPNPGTSLNQFDGNGLAVIAGNDIWAVGLYANIGGGYQTLTAHWNGSSWSVVPSPSPGSANNILPAAAAAGAGTDVWAVGLYNNGSYYQTLTEHWNGSAWSIVPGPNTWTESALFGAAAVASNDVWAVGHASSGSDRTLTEHWNGSSWSVVPSPNSGAAYNDLDGVTAVTASDIWAVGSYINTGGLRQTLIEHWDGGVWSIVPSP